VEKAVLSLVSYDWLIFTSVNGVKYFWKQLDEIGLDARILGGIEVAAIGPATADALRDKGIKPDFVPEKYVAESVVEGLLEKGIAGKKVLIPRAKVAREVLPQGKKGSFRSGSLIWASGLIQHRLNETVFTRRTVEIDKCEIGFLRSVLKKFEFFGRIKKINCMSKL
jgi:hypothetical protein